MKLAEALAGQDLERLRRLAAETGIESSAHLSPAVLRSRLETAINTRVHVGYVVGSLRPPILPVLTTLLEHGLDMPAERCRAIAEEESTLIDSRVTSGALLDRDGCRIYRRVLAEAWRSDLQIDTSESRLLSVLRRELGMRRVEHFLAAHHRDVRRYWATDDPFATAIAGLVDAGIVYIVGDHIVLPVELAPEVREAIGVHARRVSTQRLLGQAPGPCLREALRAAGAPLGGTKEEMIQRLVDHFVSPVDVLMGMNIHDLRELAYGAGCVKSGSKQDLIDRIVSHFDNDIDLVDPESEKSLAPIREERALDESMFRQLFMQLKGNELARILWKLPHLKQSGPKVAKVSTLFESHLSESSLLGFLDNQSLVVILRRNALPERGSKAVLVGYLVEAARTNSFSGDPIDGSE